MRVFIVPVTTLMVLTASGAAYAVDCVLQSNGETRAPGTVIYNSDHEVLQGCQSNGTWKAISGASQAPAPPPPPTGYFDVTTATYVQSRSTAAQDGVSPNDVKFSADGMKMFTAGSNNDLLYEYSLTSAFDVSTASYVDSLTLTPMVANSNPSGLAFSANGMKLFVTSGSGDQIGEFTLGTAYDISTASFVDAFVIAAQDGNPHGLAFNADGTKMYALGSTNDSVYQYSLGTGFDVSTASYVGSYSIAAQDGEPRGLAFSPDGTKMFHTGNTNDRVYQYDLGTAFEISSATYTGFFSVAAQDTTPGGITFNPDGSKMYMGGRAAQAVYEYDLGF